MNTISPSVIEGARNFYQTQYEEEVVQIDALVESLQTDTSFRWTPGDAIRRWDTIVEAFVDEHEAAETPRADIQVGYDVLTTGTFNGTRIDVDHARYKIGSWGYRSSEVQSKTLNDAVDSYGRRLFYAQLAAYHPQDFATMQSHDVFALHGTQGVILPTVISQNGLLSHYDQRRNGVKTGTGEVSPIDSRRRFISFAAAGERTPLRYAESQLGSPRELAQLADHRESYPGYGLRLDEIREFQAHVSERIVQGDDFLEYAYRNRFGILFGLSKPALWMAGIDTELGVRVSVWDATYPEYGFARKVSLVYLPVISVSDDHRQTLQDYLATSIDRPPALISTESIDHAISAGATTQYGVLSDTISTNVRKS